MYIQPQRFLPWRFLRLLFFERKGQMQEMRQLVFLVGLFLLGLGGVSGVILLLKASAGNKEGVDTLWGLFLMGITGLGLVIWSMS